MKKLFSWKKLLALTCALFIGALTIWRAEGPQEDDYISHQAYNEIDAWIHHTPVPASDAYGPERESKCGIFYFTHHPLLASYLSVIAGELGFDPRTVQHDGAAFASGAFVYVLGAVSPVGGVLTTIGITAALLEAPGYYGWLTYPIGSTWAVTALFMIALAAMSRRPQFWIPVTVFIVAWFVIDLVVMHAAMVTGVLLARFGFSRRTLRIGLCAILAYVGANVIHIGQVWCHFDWNWGAVVSDYFTGENGGTSLSMRITRLDARDRVIVGLEQMRLYGKEVLTNSIRDWTYPSFWFVILSCLALFPVTQRSALGTVVFWLIFLSTAFLVPGLLMPHLHYLPRYVIMYPLGGLLVLGVGEYCVRKRENGETIV